MKSWKLICATLLASISVVPAVAAIRTGYIGVEGLGSTSYVSNSFNVFGEYKAVAGLGDALTVQFDDTTSIFSIIALNNASDGASTYFGGITGFSSPNSSLEAGSHSYAYLGGTALTAVGALPGVGANSFTTQTGLAKDIESSIWSLSGTTLVANWVNADGQSIVATPLYANDGNQALVITGDLAAFNSTFSTSYPGVSLKFIQTGIVEGAVPEASTWMMMICGFGMIGGVMRRREKNVASVA